MIASRFLDMKKQVLEGRKDRPLCNVIMAYMDTVSVLLSFIRASREGLWALHLASLEQLCPMFFSQNRLSYAQHTQEYLAKMHQLEHTDPEVWQSFQAGNFYVKKGPIPFTSLGVDHALEPNKRIGHLKSLVDSEGLHTNNLHSPDSF